ncbi:MAG: hypothetical protein WBA93_12710 [Microcoleaceae cyanobacterium]
MNNLDELRKRLTSIITELTSRTITSLGEWDFILKAIFMAGIQIILACEFIPIEIKINQVVWGKA